MKRIGIVALSSVVQPVEFEIGADFLRSQGFELVIHPQVYSQHWLHAGADDARAAALMDYAHDASIDFIWCARGGWGAAKTLPILDRLTAERGKPPRKLLVGYSDVTVAHEFVRSRWGWSTLHAAMPAAANFSTLPPADWSATLAAVTRADPIDWPWSHVNLCWLSPPPAQSIEALLIGGNLSLWQTLAGTPFAPSRRPHILFLEDLSEKFYRIDRMMTHIEQSGLLDTCVALILGDLTDCQDEHQTCLAQPPEGVERRALLHKQAAARRELRPTYAMNDLLREVFTTIGIRRNLPIATGLPVGHGPHFAPLPLGARYRLSSAGTLELIEWDWLSRATQAAEAPVSAAEGGKAAS